MAKPISFYGVAIADNTLAPNGKPESTTAEVPIADIDETNFVAVSAAANDLRLALEAITLGVVYQQTLIAERFLVTARVPAASNLAQGENKWLCRYHDNTTYSAYVVSFGTADLSLLTANSEFLSLAAGVGLAFKTAFEAVVKSPADSTHSVTLDSVQFVGRNS